MKLSMRRLSTFNSLDFQLTHNQHWTNLSSYYPLATILLPSSYYLPTYFLLSCYLLPSGFLEHTLNVASSYLECTLDVPCRYFVFTKRINPSQIVLYCFHLLIVNSEFLFFQLQKLSIVNCELSILNFTLFQVSTFKFPIIIFLGRSYQFT